jgi:hypothetical protein
VRFFVDAVGRNVDEELTCHPRSNKAAKSALQAEELQIKTNTAATSGIEQILR